MVQTHRDEHPVDEAVEEGPQCAGAADELTDRRQTGVEERVEVAEREAEEQARQRDHDRDEPAPAEEAEVGRQLDVVVAVEQPRGDQTDRDPGEDAVVDHRLSAGGVRCPVQHDGRHGGEDRVDDEVARHRGQGGGAVGLLGEPDGHTDREQQRQVGEDGAACGAHGIEEGADDKSVDLPQQVGLPESQQDAGGRQQCDGQHQALAESLQLGEPRGPRPRPGGLPHGWCGAHRSSCRSGADRLLGDLRRVDWSRPIGILA